MKPINAYHKQPQVRQLQCR